MGIHANPAATATNGSIGIDRGDITRARRRMERTSAQGAERVAIAVISAEGMAPLAAAPHPALA